MASGEEAITLIYVGKCLSIPRPQKNNLSKQTKEHINPKITPAYSKSSAALAARRAPCLGLWLTAEQKPNAVVAFWLFHGSKNPLRISFGLWKRVLTSVFRKNKGAA